MTNRRTVVIRRRILEVRLAQRAVAQSRAEQASAEVRSLQARRSDAARGVAEGEAAWSVAIESPALGWSIARVWAARVADGALALRTLESEIDGAEAARTRAVGEWRDAVSCEDVAGRLARSAARSVLRRAEEAALSEIADRAAQRGSGS